MSKRSQLVPAALLAMLLGIFVVLRGRPVPTAVPTPQVTAAPERDAARPESAKKVRPAEEAGPRVRGLVLTENREPIEGARIWVGNGWWNFSKPLGATAKDGSYALVLPETDLPNYRQIHVMAEGFRPETRKLGPIVGEKGPTILLHRSPLLHGVVLERDSWRRLGGVTVQVKRDSLNENPLLEVQARHDGTFDIGSLPSGQFVLSARGVGYKAALGLTGDGGAAVPEDVPPAVASLYPGQTILVLPPTGTALVTVKDEAGKPVVGAEVRNEETVKTDAEGRARMESLPEGDEGVAVYADGYVPGYEKFQLVAHAEAKVDVVLRKGGARLFGTITVAEGQPEPRSVELWPGDLGSEGAHCRHAEVHSAVAAGRQYSLHVPHGESVRLVVRFESERGEGRIPWFDRGSVTLSYGQSLERNLVIDPLCKLVIAVKDTSGRPVAGASVHWEGGTSYSFERETFSGTLSEGEATRFGETLGNRRKGWGVSDASGALTAFVVKGEYAVQVTHGEFKPHKGQRFPVGGDATREVVMERALRVSGRLSTWDGKPADGWWVGIGRRGNEEMTTSDGDGAFTLDSVLPGPQKLQVCWPQYIQTELMSQTVEVTEGMAPLEIRLPPLPTLRGRLRGFRLQDLGEARFECGVSDEQVGYMTVRFAAEPDAQGLLTLGPMPVATYYYTLKVRLNGSSQSYIAARGKVIIAPARETTLDFDCEAPGSVAIDIDIAESSRYDRYQLILKRPDGSYVDSAAVDVAPRSAMQKKIELMAAPGKYLVEVVGSINYTEDRSHKVFSGTATLDASGKVLLSAASR